MDKFKALNEFLNKVDVVDIASDSCDEYDIEANSLIENFNSSMDLDDVSELFESCMFHFFMIECSLSADQVQLLYDILKSQ